MKACCADESPCSLKHVTGGQRDERVLICPDQVQDILLQQLIYSILQQHSKLS